MIYYSESDEVAAFEDVERLKKNLINVKAECVKNFNHLDFVFGSNANKIYNDIIVYLNGY